MAKYSLLNDKACCLPCLLLTVTESPFASTGFNMWMKALGSKSSFLEKHNASEVYKLAEEKACLFIHLSFFFFLVGNLQH